MPQSPRNLPMELYELLNRHSSEHAERWHALFIQEMASNEIPPENRQIQQMNNFWRVQLGMLNVNTLAIRGYLYDDIDPDYWLQNFERYIMRSVLKYQLPCQKPSTNIG